MLDMRRVKPKAASQSDGDTQERQPQALPDYKPQHIGSFSTECHADADLVRALRGRVRNHPVHPDCRQHQSQPGEDAE